MKRACRETSIDVFDTTLEPVRSRLLSESQSTIFNPKQPLDGSNDNVHMVLVAGDSSHQRELAIGSDKLSCSELNKGEELRQQKEGEGHTVLSMTNEAT